jgi:hypothetical protein
MPWLKTEERPPGKAWLVGSSIDARRSSREDNSGTQAQGGSDGRPSRDEPGKLLLDFRRRESALPRSETQTRQDSQKNNPRARRGSQQS